MAYPISEQVLDETMDRDTLLRSLIGKSERGLEIGPSYNPVASRSLGYTVDVLDHESADGLRAKYANEPNIDISRIEHVDFVWSGQTLSATVGRTGAYDYIVASHVIEHMPDMLGFINECALLLKPEGRLVLAVPDMRRCFDALRPLSSLGGVLQASNEKRARHTPATAFEHVAYMTLLDGRAGWSRPDQGSLTVVNDIALASAVYERSLADLEYYDFHAWVFTPSSFRLLMTDLHTLGRTQLREVEFHLTDSFEFIAVLSANGNGPAVSRAELALGVRMELLETPVK